MTAGYTIKANVETVAVFIKNICHMMDILYMNAPNAAR